MKTEPNIGIKSAFFAQYWSQKVVAFLETVNDPLSVQVRHEPRSVINFSSLEKTCLVLKSLGILSSNTAFEIHKIMGTINRNDYIEEEAYMTDAYSEGTTLVDNFHNGDSFALNHEAIDYLRSRGYALPYLNFSVKDLVSFGWVKLI